MQTHALSLVLLTASSFSKTSQYIKDLQDKEYLSFSVIGDWGGIPYPPYQTPSGQNVANKVNERVTIDNTNFLLLIGDNFYGSGVKNIESYRFDKTFENTFNSNLTNLIDMPMYILAGNHDYYGNVTAELEYAKRSSRWTFPSYYYQVPVGKFDNFSVDLLMVDTNILLKAQSIDEDANDVDLRYTQHYNWIESKLESSTADYIIVVGHHTIQSISKHGPNSSLIGHLSPLLKKYNVNMYICGHDHNLQVLSETFIDENNNQNEIKYVVSGSSTWNDPSTPNINNLSSNVLSEFFWVDTTDNYAGYSQVIVTENEMTVLMINGEDQSVMYSVKSGKRGGGN